MIESKTYGISEGVPGSLGACGISMKVGGAILIVLSWVLEAEEVDFVLLLIVGRLDERGEPQLIFIPFPEKDA